MYAFTCLCFRYIRQIDEVMIPHQVVAMLPSSAPTYAVMTHPPSLPPTPRVCNVNCDQSSTYCSSSGGSCLCLPGYIPTPGSVTNCTYQGVTTGPLTTTGTINQAAFLQDAMQHALTITCGTTVRGSTMGNINIIGNAAGDILYVNPSTTTITTTITITITTATITARNSIVLIYDFLVPVVCWIVRHNQ